MRRWSLAGQMLVLQLLVVAVTVAGLAVLALVQAHELLTDEASSKAEATRLNLFISSRRRTRMLSRCRSRRPLRAHRCGSVHPR